MAIVCLPLDTGLIIKNMGEDNATLHDATVIKEPDAPAAPPAKEPEAPIVDTSDKDAAEVGRILLESGVSKDQLNDLLAAPRALATLRYMVQNDPEAFLKELERTDPEAGENFQQKLADLYVARYGDRGKSGGEEKANDQTSELMRRLDDLKAETDRLRNKEQQRDAALANASSKERYNNRVKDLFDQESIKKLGLTPSEQKAMKARLDVELAADPQKVSRVSSGNYVDVPTTFKGIVEEWANDKKSASEAEAKARSASSNAMFPEFISGSNMFQAQIPDKVFDSWDATEEGFAEAVSKLSKR